MNDREKIPWENLIQQWEGETPLLLTDQAVGQLLGFAKETQKELHQHKEYIQTLSLTVAELRVQVRVLTGEGRQDE